jgi:hypothetical protein
MPRTGGAVAQGGLSAVSPPRRDRPEVFSLGPDLACGRVPSRKCVGEYGDSRGCGLSGPKCSAADSHHRCWLAYFCH